MSALLSVASPEGTKSPKAGSALMFCPFSGYTENRPPPPGPRLLHSANPRPAQHRAATRALGCPGRVQLFHQAQTVKNTRVFLQNKRV